MIRISIMNNTKALISKSQYVIEEEEEAKQSEELFIIV